MFENDEASLEDMLNALAAYRGLRTDEAIAKAVRQSGYKVSQQSVNNSRRREIKTIKVVKRSPPTPT